MRGFRIYDHTEKVGGSQKGRTRGVGYVRVPRDTGLGEDCQYRSNGEPVFRVVGNDSTFCRLAAMNQLRYYLNQIPEYFEMYRSQGIAPWTIQALRTLLQAAETEGR